MQLSFERGRLLQERASNSDSELVQIFTLREIPGGISPVFGQLSLQLIEGTLELTSDPLKDGEAGMGGRSLFLDFAETQNHFELMNIALLIRSLGLVPPLKFLGRQLLQGVRMKAPHDRAVELL